MDRTTDLTGTPAQPWWRGASFYQIYPRSFADSNGDGEGDLMGISSRLDHLEWLGVGALWLSPFYPSPLADGGYDVADPRGVDPRFGTIEDIRYLIDAAHLRDIKVVVDVVPNHVSVEHRWFRQAVAAAPGSPERERFHFRKGKGPGQPPNNWISVFGGSAWTQLPPTGADPDPEWYLHVFDSSQPDLNWSNPEVVEDAEETLRFWLDEGVDGFRVDVAFGLVKDMTYADHPDPEGVIRAMRLDLFDGVERDPDPRAVLLTAPFFDRDEVHEIYRRWRTVLDKYPGDRMAVAEAWAYPASRAMAYARADELNQVFNFDFLVVNWEAAQMRRIITGVLDEVALVGAPPTWVLCNHDTPRVVTRLGGGESGRRKALALALVAHALPGGVYVYQGEELGLADAEIPDHRRQDPIWFRSHGTDPGRDGGRVPLPWSGDAPPYGFSDAADTWLPQPEGWQGFSVQEQRNNESSPLHLYRNMLRLRREHAAFSDADASVRFEDAPAGVLRFTRESSCGTGICVIANTTGEPVSVAVGEQLPMLLATAECLWEGDVLVVPGDSAVWLERA